MVVLQFANQSETILIFRWVINLLDTKRFRQAIEEVQPDYIVDRFNFPIISAITKSPNIVKAIIMSVLIFVVIL